MLLIDFDVLQLIAPILIDDKPVKHKASSLFSFFFRYFNHSQVVRADSPC